MRALGAGADKSLRPAGRSVLSDLTYSVDSGSGGRAAPNGMESHS